MPTYQGQLSEEQLLQLIEYIKSLPPRAQRREAQRPIMTDATGSDGRNYLNVDYRFRSWLWTTDHKRIAILFMISVTLFFFVGGAAAVLFRLELMTPRGDLVIAETFNKLFTLHGVVMVFFFLIPSIPDRAGQFFAADDDRCPRPGLPAAQPGELVHLHDGRR